MLHRSYIAAFLSSRFDLIRTNLGRGMQVSAMITFFAGALPASARSALQMIPNRRLRVVSARHRSRKSEWAPHCELHLDSASGKCIFGSRLGTLFFVDRNSGFRPNTCDFFGDGIAK
jgi:hypothetical protein